MAFIIFVMSFFLSGMFDSSQRAARMLDVKQNILKPTAETLKTDMFMQFILLQSSKTKRNVLYWLFSVSKQYDLNTVIPCEAHWLHSEATGNVWETFWNMAAWMCGALYSNNFVQQLNFQRLCVKLKRDKPCIITASHIIKEHWAVYTYKAGFQSMFVSRSVFSSGRPSLWLWLRGCRLQPLSWALCSSSPASPGWCGPLSALQPSGSGRTFSSRYATACTASWT